LSLLGGEQEAAGKSATAKTPDEAAPGGKPPRRSH
jgi:hypothetical protein